MTLEAVPAEQRLVVGAAEADAPLAEPQVPVTAVGAVLVKEAEQEAVDPRSPEGGAQVQVQGPEPETEEAVPVVQRVAVGAAVRDAPFDDPQTPLTVCSIEALQLAVAPPLDPTQVQFQGPEPETEEAVPVVQRLDEGLVAKVPVLAEPQAPLTRVI